MEERLLEIEISSKRFNNLTKGEQEPLYTLKDDPSIIKGADRGSLVVWSKENCLKEAYRQLKDKKLYDEVTNNILMKAFVCVCGCVCVCVCVWGGDLWRDALNYFLVNDPNLARFYLLS